MRMIVAGNFGVRIVWASCVERLVAGRRMASFAAAVLAATHNLSMLDLRRFHGAPRQRLAS